MEDSNKEHIDTPEALSAFVIKVLRKGRGAALENGNAPETTLEVVGLESLFALAVYIYIRSAWNMYSLEIYTGQKLRRMSAPN